MKLLSESDSGPYPMSTKTLQESVDVTRIAADALEAAIDLVRRVFAQATRAARTDEDRWLEHVLVEIATPVLTHNGTLDELDVLLEVALESDGYQLLHQTLKSKAKAHLQQTRPKRIEWDDEFLLALGPGAKSAVLAATKLVPVVVKATEQNATAMELLIKQLGLRATDFVAGAEKEALNNPLFFLTDPLIPPAVGQVLLDFSKGAICAYAISAAALRPALRPQSYVGLAIAEGWEKGQYSLLRYLSALPWVQVAEDVVPLDDRLDMKNIFTIYAEQQKAVDELLRKAKDSGESVFPPSSDDGL